jgi:hypothetical protein
VWTQVVGKCAPFKARAPAVPRKPPSTEQFAWGQSSMNQRKPDLLWILVFIFGLGVVTTGYAQGFWERKLDNAYQMPVDAGQPQR